MEQIPMKLGAKIATLRKAKGLTQEQLAETVGVSAPAVSKWENDNSYPDIMLLCPLARALGTNVDTLLQFEETLSDQEVIQQINDIIHTALYTDVQTAESRLQELLHRYPNCTALQFNSSVAYDAFQMFFPSADAPLQTRWRDSKRKLLEQVRISGNAAYWQAATLQLASLAIADSKLESAQELLQALPDQGNDPAGVWAQYYLKKDQPQEARKIIQKQLFKLTNQLTYCLLLLTNTKLATPPKVINKAITAYQFICRQFGFLDMSDGIRLNLYLQQGDIVHAAQCFVRLVDTVTGPAVYPDTDFFVPGLSFQIDPNRQATTKELRQMLYRGIVQDAQYRVLDPIADVQVALAKLKASL